MQRVLLIAFHALQASGAQEANNLSLVCATKAMFAQEDKPLQHRQILSCSQIMLTTDLDRALLVTIAQLAQAIPCHALPVLTRIQRVSLSASHVTCTNSAEGPPLPSHRDLVRWDMSASVVPSTKSPTTS